MNSLIENNKSRIVEICRKLLVKRIYVFGSVVSAGFRPDSDIDFLISFQDGISIEDYTENYFSLHYHLRDLLKSEIDITTEKTLSNPYLIESINKSKRLIYEAWNP